MDQEKIKEAEKILAEKILDELPDDDRLEVFSLYCRSCGRKDPRCQCGNDD